MKEYFCFNTDCIVYQAKQEAQKANRLDLLETYNRRLCKLCRDGFEKDKLIKNKEKND